MGNPDEVAEASNKMDTGGLVEEPGGDIAEEISKSMDEKKEDVGEQEKGEGDTLLDTIAQPDEDEVVSGVGEEPAPPAGGAAPPPSGLGGPPPTAVPPPAGGVI